MKRIGCAPNGRTTGITTHLVEIVDETPKMFDVRAFTAGAAVHRISKSKVSEQDYLQIGVGNGLLLRLTQPDASLVGRVRSTGGDIGIGFEASVAARYLEQHGDAWNLCIGVHSGSVTRFRVTPDDATLLSAVFGLEIR